MLVELFLSHVRELSFPSVKQQSEPYPHDDLFTPHGALA